MADPAPAHSGTPAPPRGGTAARTLRNGLALGGSKAATYVVLFAWQVMLARELGLRGYGIYAALGAALALAAVLPDFGLGLVVARDAAKRPDLAPRLLAATLLIQPALGTMAAACLVAFAWRVTAAQGLGALIVLAALPLLTDTVGNVCHAQLVAAERLVAPSAIALLHAAVLVGVGAPLVWGGAGLWGVYAAIVAASLVRAGVYWHRLRAAGIAPAWPVASALIRRLLAEGWPLALLMLVGIARLYADKLLVTQVLGVAATGQLQAAFVVAFGVSDLLNATMLTAVLPVMARMFQERRRAELDLLVERLACAGLLVGVPLAFGSVLFARQVSGALFGASFAATPRLLVILLAATAVTMTGNAFQQSLIVAGRQGALLAVRATVLACHLTLLLALVPRLGVIGAAIAALATETGALVVLAAVARPPAASLRRIAFAALRIVAAAGVAPVAARAVDPGAGPLALLVLTAGFAAGVVAARVVSAAEWRLLREAVGALAGRRGGA